MNRNDDSSCASVLRQTLLVFSLAAAYAPAHGQLTTSLSRIYDPVTGKVQSETRDGVATSYTYHPTGDLWTVTNALGVVTRYSNYKRGIAQTEVRAEGRPEQVTLYREVDDKGCVTSQTDGEGNKTQYGRDASCRVTSITPPKPGSAMTTVVYKPYDTTTGHETETRTRGNHTIVKTFDGFGRLLQEVGGGVKRTWRYDALNRKKFQSYPVDASVANPGGTSFDYDALSRVMRITHVDGSFQQFDFQTSVSGSPQIRITDERGNVTTQTLRAFGDPDDAELMAIGTPEPAADVVMRRNVRDQITQVDQGGLSRVYGFDSRFYLTSVVNPETGTTTMGRNDLGELTSLSVGNSGTTYYDINGLGQITGIRYPNSAHNVSKTWYRNGKAKTATTATSALSWTHDPNGNLTEETLNVGGHEFLTSYGYDTNDRREWIQYPKRGSRVTFAPDVLGRPTQAAPFVTEVGYHPNGVIKSMTYANGVRTEVAPDVRQRPRTIAVGRNGGSAYVGMTIDYDTENNVTGVTDTANSNNNRSYGYDGIDRLNRVTVGGVDYPIVYDGVGNIHQQNFGGTLNYTYHPTNNRLTGTSGLRATAYSYDARGNITSDGNLTFEYDDFSRLRCAKCFTPDRIDYDYDGLGMRLSRTKGGQTTLQTYAGNGDLLLEFEPATNERREHVYLKGQKVATLTGSAYFATTLNLTVSAASIIPGQTVTVTATVSGGRTPGGTVNFYDNGVLLGSATVVNGQATFTTSALGFGYHRITAAYAGDGANAVSNTAAATQIESGAVGATITGIINMLLED